jgi:hypothetical protein
VKNALLDLSAPPNPNGLFIASKFVQAPHSQDTVTVEDVDEMVSEPVPVFDVFHFPTWELIPSPSTQYLFFLKFS